MSIKIGYAFPMVAISLLPHVGLGADDHREDAHHFTEWSYFYHFKTDRQIIDLRRRGTDFKVRMKL